MEYTAIKSNLKRFSSRKICEQWKKNDLISIQKKSELIFLSYFPSSRIVLYTNSEKIKLGYWDIPKTEWKIIKVNSK